MATIKKFTLLALTALMMAGCEQYVSRAAGGIMTIHLEPNQRLMEVTWKEGDLWYLTEPMDSDYIPKTKVFQENSLYGVLEGKVIFVENRN